MEKKVVIITGASSGIGKKTALLLNQAGYMVFGGSRKIESDQELIRSGILVKNLDVTDSLSIQKFVQFVYQTAKQIDILINCAGYGSYGPIENVSIQEAKNQMNVNVFGVMEMIQQVLPYMRQQNEGKIINISSIAGRTYSYLGGWYHASKWSLEVLSDCLRMEVKPFHIQVALIEPGLIKTPWGIVAAKHLADCTKNTPYEKSGTQVAQYLTQNYTDNANLTAPEVVAKTIYKACVTEKMKKRYLIGYMAKSLLHAYKVLPQNCYDAIIMNRMKPKSKD